MPCRTNSGRLTGRGRTVVGYFEGFSLREKRRDSCPTAGWILEVYLMEEGKAPDSGAAMVLDGDAGMFERGKEEAKRSYHLERVLRIVTAQY